MNIEKRIEFWRYLRKEHQWMISKPRVTDKRNGAVCKYLVTHKKTEAVINWELEQMAKDFKDYMNKGTSHTIKF